MKVLIALLWLITLLATCVGAVVLLMAFNAEAAPAQGAAAALACGCAIIPYVFTRAVEGMNSKT